MLENNNNLNLDDKGNNKNNNDKSKLNIISTDTKAPNSSLRVCHSFITKKSQFYNIEMNQANYKRIKPIRKGTGSLDTKRKKNYLFDKIKNEELKSSIIGIKKQRKNSLLFTERNLKEKLEKKRFSVQMEYDIGKDKMEAFEKEVIDKNNYKRNKTKKKFYLSDNFLSKNKEQIKDSVMNKHLKRRRKISNNRLLKEKIKEINRKIFKINHVYDSLEDSEENYNSNEETFYISPESKFIYILDFLIVFCLFICIFYIPLKISYYKNKCVYFSTLDKICLNFIDILFIIDLIVGLYRGYYNSELKMVNNYKLIMCNYLLTNFIYDFISALPFLSLLEYYHMNICKPFINSNTNQNITIFFLCGLKFLKYIKIEKNNKFLENINEISSKSFTAEQILDSLKMFLFIFSILHVLVCCHIFMGFHFYPSWLISVQDKFSIDNYTSIYITSFYFLITTLTTVGYGDIVCISMPERILKLIELSFGVILYSYIVSKLGDSVKVESYATMTFNNNSAILEDIRISYPKMPFKLYHKILHYLQSNVHQQKKNDINLLINSLPYVLKHTLLFVINKNHIDHFYFFKKCYNSNFITYSLLNFVPATYKKNVLILKEDQLIDNAIFITQGRLSLEIAIDLESPEESINKYLSKNYNPLRYEKDNNKFKYKSTTNFILPHETIENKNGDKVKNILEQYTVMNDDIMDVTQIDTFFDESNYQFLNISNIFKNEHYGEVFIIFKKPSPLFLRVRSKKANLLLLSKKSILHLSSNFNNIWKRIFKKSLKNMKALRKKTIETVKKYIIAYNLKCFNDESSFVKKKTVSNSIYESPNLSIKEGSKASKRIESVCSNLKTLLTKNIINMQQNEEENFEDFVQDDIINDGHKSNLNEKEEKIVEKQNNEKKRKNAIKEMKEKELLKIIEKSSKKKINDVKNMDHIKLSDVKIKKLNENKTLIIQPKNPSKNNIKISIEPKDKYKSSITGDNNVHKSTKYKSSVNSRKNLEKIYIQKLENMLKEETNKRKYYQKLCKILNKKIKKLYKTLIDNSIHISNISNIEDTKIRNDLDISKIVSAKKNNNNVKDSKILKVTNTNLIDFTTIGRSLTMSLKNKIRKLSYRPDKNPVDIKKLKNCKTKLEKNKLNKKKTKSNAKPSNKSKKNSLISYNISKSFNKEDNNDNNELNKFLQLAKSDKNTNKLKQNYFKDKSSNNVININRMNLSSIFSDNSQNSILDSKRKKRNAIIETDDSKKKFNIDYNNIKKKNNLLSLENNHIIK